MADSEAEWQILGVACGVAINQCPEADLVSNSSTAEPFGDDADHNSEHGSSAVEEFNALELLHVDVASCGALEPCIAGLAWLHGVIDLLLRIVNPFLAIPPLVIFSP